MPIGTEVIEAEEQSRDPDNDEIIILGAVEDFAIPSITRYRHFRNGRFHLMRYPDGGFLALPQACTHQGCSVPWSPEEQRFPCPCHGSVYGEKGQLINGPAPRPLDVYPIAIVDGMIRVDKSARIQRSNALPEDLVYP
jgi:cytochrome b6-f complex iron-sulfur subunit